MSRLRAGPNGPRLPRVHPQRLSHALPTLQPLEQAVPLKCFKKFNFSMSILSEIKQ